MSELAIVVRRLMAKLRDDPGPFRPATVAMALRHDCIPMTVDSSGCHAIRPDGSILVIGDEEGVLREEFEPRTKNRVLQLGARLFPDLAPFAPLRTSEDPTCGDCGGDGRARYAGKLLPEGIVCSCGGLGWVPGEAVMDYPKFESALCEKLKQAGWIESLDYQRDGTYITWSAEGAAHKPTFIEDVNAIYPCRTEELKTMLRDFGQVHEMIGMSKLDRFRSQLSWMIGEGPFLVIACDSEGRADYALFQNNDEAAAQWMYAAADAGKEVIVVETKFLKEGKLPRMFPFGARGYWDPNDATGGDGGKALWRRPDAG